jgi:hypothetical protein
MATVGIEGDVLINAKPYRIDVTSYQRRDIVDFSPRASTATGASISYSELGLYQTLTQEDFRHGFGFYRFTDAAGYQRTEGDMDTRHPGLVMRYTKVADVSDTNNNLKNGGVTFGQYFYTWGPGDGESPNTDGVREFKKDREGGEWTEALGDDTNYLIVGNSYIFALRNGNRVQKAGLGDQPLVSGDWSNAGLDGNIPTDMKIAAMHGGFLWFAEDGNSFVHYDDTDDMSTLEGNGETDANVVVVGPGGLPIVNMISFANALYVARKDGLWVVNQDDEFTARQVLNFSAEAHADNFRSMVVFQGALYFPIRHRIYRWTGSTIVDVTPQRLDDTFPFNQFSEYDNFISRGSYLYCTAQTDESPYTQSILAYDGVGWHRLMDPIVSHASDEISMMALDPANDYIWFHLNKSSDATYFIPLREKSDFPKESFSTSSHISGVDTHYWYSSIHDMGFRKVTKSLRSIEFETDNCDSNNTITVAYSLDGAAFTSDDLSSSGVINADTYTTLTFDDTKEFKNIQLRLDFTAEAAQSPVLKSLSMKYMMRPDTSSGYVFDVIAASDLEYGGVVDSRTAAEIISDLLTVRASTAPVVFVNLVGETKNVYLASITESARSRESENPELPDVEHRVRISLVET